jgi:hypothetical protein
MGRMAFTEPQCLYKGALYLLYLQSSLHGTVVEKMTVA